jgi:hypothetical protein
MVMQPVGGTPSTAMDLLSILQPHKRLQTAATAPVPEGTSDQSNVFAGQIAGGGTADAASTSSAAGPRLDANVLGFLILSQGQQSTDTAGAGTPPLSPGQSRLFAKLDTNGDGTISKSELQAALGANGDTPAADSAFGSLDRNGDGSIDPGEFAAAKPHRQRHHLMTGSNEANAASGANAGQDGGLAKLMATLGTSSQATNPDGSTTTTITYQDGSKVTLSTPVQQAAATTATGSSGVQPASRATNSLETLIRLQLGPTGLFTLRLAG